jgi:soluble lytic murein transglycosylase
VRRILRHYVTVIAFLGILSGVSADFTPSAAETLTKKQRSLYTNALALADRDQWSEVKRLTARGGNSAANKILEWMRLRSAIVRAGYPEVSAFIKANPAWPDQDKLRRRAEEMMGGLPTDAVLAWFDRYPMESPDGAYHLANALEAADRGDEAAKAVRHAWITMELGPKQATEFKARFRKHLGQNEEIAKLEYLLWEREVRAARRQMRKVPQEWRRLTQARIALMIRAGNASALLRRVKPDMVKNQGIVFERVRWRRRAKRMDEAIDLLLANRPVNPSRPDRWWRERNYLARWALKEERPELAYRLASEHGQPGGIGFAGAEWLAGWIALRKLDKPDAALKHFKALYEKVKFPVSRSRGAYWAARALETKERHSVATTWYRTAAQHMTRFYGQVASGHVLAAERPTLPPEREPTDAERRKFEAHDAVRAIRVLAQLDRRRDIKRFLLGLADDAKTQTEWTLAARLAQEMGRHDVGVSIAKRALRKGVILGTTGYPALEPVSDGGKDFPDPALIFSVVRQESAFDAKAISHAGARGLMQIMPQTALRVARKLKVPYSRNRLTRDPAYNLRLGQAYLANMIRDYDGSLILALAAYNAGPLRVERWLRRYGDPGPSIYDAIDWIESIPFTETRTYVQRVLENLTVYRRRADGLNMALTFAAMEPGPFRDSAGRTDRIAGDPQQDGEDFAGP